MNINQIYDRLLCVVFPRRCKYCGEVITPSEKLCRNCTEYLPRIDNPRCKKCGKSKDDCFCKGKSSYYDSIVAPFYYEGSIAKAIGRLKFQLKPFLAEGYAEDMAQCVKDNLNGINHDVICYVPFSDEDTKRREFNHSRIIASHLSKMLGIPLSDAIVRLYSNRVQHTLSSSERNGNVFAVFDIKDADAVRGKSVLLVDDIKTTEATLSECAKMLKIYEAVRVDCVTFALGRGKQNVDSQD